MNPRKEIAGVTLIVATVRTSQAFLFHAAEPAEDSPGRANSAAMGSAPCGDLRPGRNRLWLEAAPGKCGTRQARCLSPPGLNVICHVTISRIAAGARRAIHLAHLLMVSSYVVVLGGTLLDNAQLFEQVSRHGRFATR